MKWTLSLFGYHGHLWCSHDNYFTTTVICDVTPTIRLLFKILSIIISIFEIISILKKPSNCIQFNIILSCTTKRIWHFSQKSQRTPPQYFTTNYTKNKIFISPPTWYYTKTIDFLKVSITFDRNINSKRELNHRLI